MKYNTNTRKLKLKKKLIKKRLTKKSKKGGAETDKYTCIDINTISCSISKEIMFDPVLAEDGQTYERSCIEEWFRRNQTSPMTRQSIGTKLISNLMVKSIINNVLDESNTANFPVKGVETKYADINILKQKFDKLKEKEESIKLKEEGIFKLIYSGNIDVIKSLISIGTNINISTINGSTPLFIACETGQYDVVKLLLENDAVVDQADDNGCTPLYVACQMGHTRVARLLLNNSADVNRPTYYGDTPLYTACEEGYVDVVRLLLENGADVDRAASAEHTPLHVSCWKGNIDTVRVLLENGANINKYIGDSYMTSFMLACQQGNIDIVNLLLEKGVDINRENLNASQWLQTESPEVSADMTNNTSRKNSLEIISHESVIDILRMHTRAQNHPGTVGFLNKYLDENL